MITSFMIALVVLVSLLLTAYSRRVVSKERIGWVFAVCALVTGSAFASVLYQGPFFIADSNGVVKVTVGSGSSTAVVPGGYLTFSRGGIVYADTNSTTTTWGTGTGNPTGTTASISQTFATAEPDINYQIQLNTMGITPTAGTGIIPFYLGDKYTDGFEVRNPAKHNSAVSFVWTKFRTATP